MAAGAACDASTADHPSAKRGANPPKDLRSLATKDNATDYIKARQEQERRYKEKWE